MLQKIKEKLQFSRIQLFVIYIVEISILTTIYLIYKSDNLNNRWIDQESNNTNFAYTKYQIQKKFQGVYWQLETTIGIIEHIFTHQDDTYPSIPLCTIDTCFAQKQNDPELDSQYQQIKAYQGAISNKQMNSTFGNLGLLLWQFKYSRAGNTQSIEIILNSSLQTCTMKLHIPIQQFPNPHQYVLQGTQNISFNQNDIIASKLFYFEYLSESIQGSVSTRLNFNRLRQQIKYYNVKLIQKHTGIIYIDNLDQQKQYLQTQLVVKVGSMTVQFILMQQLIIIKTHYINLLYILAFIFLIGLVPVYNNVNIFYQKHINPINSINSILKQKLNISFNSNQVGKHNLTAVNQQLNNLCIRCEQVPNYFINKQKITKNIPYQQQFRFSSKLNQIHQKFKSKILMSQYQTYIYNNKFIIRINQDFQNQKKILKQLYFIINKQQFFKVCYLCVCCSSEEQYFTILSQIFKKYDLKKDQRIILPRFYHRFHTKSLQQLRAKINGQSEKQLQSDKDLADDLSYFEGLHINVHQLENKGPYFKDYYQKAFFQRIQNLILSRFLVFVKDCDKNLKYLKQLELENKLFEIQLEVDNFRYQMSKKQTHTKEFSFI